MRFAMKICLGLMLVAAASVPARADASANHDLFKDFVFSGCMGVFSGTPIEIFAQVQQLTPAAPNLAAAFLHGRPGNAFMKVTPDTVLIIAQAGDYCTVASRAV